MLRKFFKRRGFFIGAALLLLTSTSLYSQTSKISYRLSTSFAHVSLNDFWQSRYGDNWSERNENLKDNYFKPQAGLTIRYAMTPVHSLLFGAGFAKVSAAQNKNTVICPIAPPCYSYQSIRRNNFYLIPFSAGYQYSFKTEPKNIIPFMGFGLAYTMGRMSEIYTDDRSDDRDVSKFRGSAYGLYVTLGFKRKLTDKLGLLFMGKYRNSDSIFGEWGSRDIELNLSGFNLGMAVEWSR